MDVQRRTFVGGMAAVATAGALPAAAQGGAMYGLIGKMTTKPGQRDAMIAILLDGVSGMPGCLSYVIAKDPVDSEAIWITEAWDNKESHAASLKMPSVQAAIAKARPLIAGMEQTAETIPVGGHGLVPYKGA
jgi:quinol monooxygenase YgiN